MKNERVIEFLKKLSTNEKAVKFLADRKNGSEDENMALLETAKELGYDLTAEDFKAFAEELAQAGKTEVTESGREISDDEVEQVTGGENLFEMLIDNIVNIIGNPDFWTDHW